VHAAVAVGAALQNCAAATKDGRANNAALLSVELRLDLRDARVTECVANHIRVNVPKDGLVKTVVECSAMRNVLHMVPVKGLQSANAVQALLGNTAWTLCVIVQMVENVWPHIRVSAHQNGPVISVRSQNATA